MKRFIVSVFAVMFAAGTLQAQDPLSLPSKFNFDGVKTESTESSHSAGRFGSYIDDFIGVNDYDGEVNTFVYLGGTGDLDNTFLSVGFAKKVKSLYFAAYYGGKKWEASGQDNGFNNENAATGSKTTWDNSFALLLGNLPFGALRLDVIADASESQKIKVDGDKVNSYRKGGITTAVTWGHNIGKLSPHVSVGFTLPENEYTDDENYEKYGAQLGIKGGTSYTLSDTSSLSGDVIIQAGFGSKGKEGDKDIGSGGDFAVFVDGGYSKTVEAGDRVTLKFKPKAGLGLAFDNTDEEYDGEKIDNPTIKTFGFNLGVDAGIEFKLHRKFNLYTGAGLKLFNFVAEGQSGGDPKGGGGSWEATGIEWDTDKWNSDNLKIGLVFNPNDNLSIGCGLNVLLDKLFVINLAEMKIEAGEFWDDFGLTNLTAGLINSTDTTIELTLSYKL